MLVIKYMLVFGCLPLAVIIYAYLSVQLLRKKSRNDYSWVSKSLIFRKIALNEKLRKFCISDTAMELIREQNPKMFG